VEAVRVIVPAADLSVFLGENVAALLACVDFLAWTPSQETPQKSFHLPFTMALGGFIVFEEIGFRKKPVATCLKGSVIEFKLARAYASFRKRRLPKCKNGKTSQKTA